MSTRIQFFPGSCGTGGSIRITGNGGQVFADVYNFDGVHIWSGNAPSSGPNFVDTPNLADPRVVVARLSDNGIPQAYSVRHIACVPRNLCTGPPPDCTNNSDCSDGNACTLNRCINGTCSNPPKNCSDGNSCTTDGCNPSSGCFNNPINCSDGLFCNGVETCSNGSCVPGTPPNCSDGNACTSDSCNETANRCDHFSISCNDGNLCTQDLCSAATGCYFPPISCNDGNACTSDSCNAATGCQHSCRESASCLRGCDGGECGPDPSGTGCSCRPLVKVWVPVDDIVIPVKVRR